MSDDLQDGIPASSSAKSLNSDGTPIGWGSPPKKNQFQKGQRPPKGAGRPKGSKNKNPLEALLDKSTTVTDSNGRRVRKTYRECLDQALVKKALSGDLTAMGMIMKFTTERDKLKARYGPSPAEIAAKEEEKKRQEENARQMFGRLREFIIPIRKLEWMGILKRDDDGNFIIAPAFLAFAMQRGEARHSGELSGEEEPDEPELDGRLLNDWVLHKDVFDAFDWQHQRLEDYFEKRHRKKR